MKGTNDSGSGAVYLWLERSDRPLSQFLTRIFVLIALACIVGFVDSLGPSRIILVVALLSAVVTSFLIENHAPVHLVDPLLVFGDFFLAIGASYIVPSLYYPSFLVSVVGLVAVGPYVGRLVVVGLVPLFAGFSYVGFVHDIEYWYLAVVAVGLSYTSGMQYGSWMRLRSEVISRRIALLYQGSNALLWEYDVDQNRFTKIQGAVERLLGMTTDECSTLFNSSSSIVEFIQVLATEDRQEQVLRLNFGDGRKRWFRFSGERRLRSDGTVMVHGVAFDVTELEESREQLKEQARQDPLTGLSNRDGLNQFIVAAQSELQHNQNDTLALLLLDLNKFKDVNDNLGHHIGDKVLQIMANRLVSFSSSEVCTARVGGDEFAIAIVADSTETADQKAREIASALTERNDQPVVVEGFRMPMSISIGISVGLIADWIMLLREADSSMYQAKRSGKGFVVHSETELLDQLRQTSKDQSWPRWTDHPDNRLSS